MSTKERLTIRPFIRGVHRSQPLADGTIFEIRLHRATNGTPLWWDVYELANADADGMRLFGGNGSFKGTRRELQQHLDRGRR